MEPGANSNSSSNNSEGGGGKAERRLSIPAVFRGMVGGDAEPAAPRLRLVEEPDALDDAKSGKPMGFEDDDATWERFQKSAVAAAKLQQSSKRSASIHRAASDAAPASGGGGGGPSSGDSFFSRAKKSVAAKDANWLPVTSIWTQKKGLSREEVQLTLFATADILASSNSPTSFTAFKRQQAANDDSSNYKALLIADTPTPLRLFEIADRVASGGLIDPELDFPVIGWFLKLVAACPNMCVDESELDDATINNVNGGAQKGNNNNNNNDDVQAPGMNRIVGSGATDLLHTKMIEEDDVLALTVAKVEMDSVSAAVASFGLTPNNNPAVLNDALKGNVTISVVQDLVSASTDEGSLAPTIYKLHVKDEYGGLYVIPSTPTMTINEIKQEALRRYGIIDFINRHDIFGIDQNHQDVVLDYLNTSVGSLARLANAHMQFHLRRKKPVSWSIPVFVHEKNTYRQIAVNAFTTVEQVVAIIVALENIDKSVSDNYAIYNQKERILPHSTFDPWAKTQEYAFTTISTPFPKVEEQPLPEIRPKPLEAPQEPTCRPSLKSKTLDTDNTSSGAAAVGGNTTSRQLGSVAGGNETPRAPGRSTFKSRLFSGFSGLKSNKDESNADAAEEEDEIPGYQRSSSIMPPVARPASAKSTVSASALPGVSAAAAAAAAAGGDFFVTRFYYGNMAYTTLRLQMNATAHTAVVSIMDKLLIKESADEYSIFVNRKSVEGKVELEKTQDLYSIHKTLIDGELFLFQRKTKIESHLRPDNSGSPHQTFANLRSETPSADTSVIQQEENASNGGGASDKGGIHGLGIPKIICLDRDDDDDDNDGGARGNHRPSLSKRISKSVEFLQRKNGLRRWTRSEEAKELCRILALLGKDKEITSEILKPKKMGYQMVPKEGWLVIRDEYEEWVDVWVSVNGNEVKLLLSSLDATTYIIPLAQCSVHMRNGPEIGNMRHTFMITDSGGSAGTSTSHTMGAKSFSEMEEWVERIKSFVKGAGGSNGGQGNSAPGAEPLPEDMTPFQVCRVLGEGESRQVLLCKQKSTKQAYAVKIVPKRASGSDKSNQQSSLEMEYRVLRTVKHPFIVKLHAAFESPQQVFLITDYVDGGELYFQLSNFGKFPEDRARFYAAEILLGIECLHGHRIVYRDLKLENILLNRDGHVVIADFWLSRMEPTTDAGLIVGPLEYLAPEIIYGQGSSYASDWWALGIILYEMMCGSHPFYSEDRSQMETNILSAALKFPKHISANAKSIVTGLLARDAANRLGTNGGEEILRHGFFAKIDPMKLANREVESPYKPEVADEKDAQLYEEVHHETAEDE